MKTPPSHGRWPYKSNHVSYLAPQADGGSRPSGPEHANLKFQNWMKSLEEKRFVNVWCSNQTAIWLKQRNMSQMECQQTVAMKLKKHEEIVFDIMLLWLNSYHFGTANVIISSKYIIIIWSDQQSFPAIPCHNPCHPSRSPSPLAVLASIHAGWSTVDPCWSPRLDRHRKQKRQWHQIFEVNWNNSE